MLCPLASHVIRCIVMVQPRKTGNRPNMTHDVKHIRKQTKQMDVNQSIR